MKPFMIKVSYLHRWDNLQPLINLGVRHLSFWCESVIDNTESFRIFREENPNLFIYLHVSESDLYSNSQPVSIIENYVQWVETNSYLVDALDIQDRSMLSDPSHPLIHTAKKHGLKISIVDIAADDDFSLNFLEQFNLYFEPQTNNNISAIDADEYNFQLFGTYSEGLKLLDEIRQCPEVTDFQIEDLYQLAAYKPVLSAFNDETSPGHLEFWEKMAGICYLLRPEEGIFQPLDYLCLKSMDEIIHSIIEFKRLYPSLFSIENDQQLC
jgi:hypothetical protein